jgi:hypothetical protein
MDDVVSKYETSKGLVKGVGIVFGVDTEDDLVNLVGTYFNSVQSEKSEGRTAEQAFSMIKNSIDKGNPIIAWIPSDITPAHVITIVGYNNKTKQLRVFNSNFPNSYQVHNPLDFYQGFIYINGLKK